MATIASYVLIGLTGWISYEWYIFTSVRNKLASIPTIGSDTFILSYFSPWRFIWHGRQIIQEGYEKYPDGVFKVPTLDTSSRWLVIVNSPKLISDIKDAKDDELSNHEFNLDALQVRYTFGGDSAVGPHHIDIVRNGLTRSLSARFSDILDEVDLSFKGHLPVSDDWTGYPVLKTIIPMICRTTNRLLVGEPICHHPEYLKIQETFTVRVVIAASIVNLFPSYLKGIVGRMITYVPRTMKWLRRFFKSTLDERLRMDAEHGRNWDRPNDLFSWALDQAPAEYRTAHDLTLWLIVINFAAIYTTSLTLSNALFELAARPEYIDALRTEIEEVIGANGWTKEAMGKMQKLDSFLRECGRFGGFAAISMARRAVKDFTLSNGVSIPAGTSVVAPAVSIHHDPSVYEAPEEFRGFRFSDKWQDGKDEQQFRHQMTSPTNDYLFFGLGKHACPGRFFAVNELKAMMAYVLMNYDIKLPERPNPPYYWLGLQRLPSKSAQILFRKRQTT